ncbi:MAG: 4Fe-4S binding protein [Promethearchaeota archaeon]
MTFSTEDVDVYRKLQDHLDKMPIGFPSTKSGSDIRVLKKLFTPKEAEIAMFLKFGWERDLESLDTIYNRIDDKRISKEDLGNILDVMGQKGLIMTKRDGDQKYYGNALLMVGIFEFQVNRLDKDFIEDFHDYFDEGWLPETLKLKGAQLRTIPVEKSIEIEQNVNNFDRVQELLKTTDDPYMVANCICKQLKDMEGHPCKVTDRREICMGFGHAAKLYIDQGWGREITKEEAINILNKNQEEGLVLQANNSQKLTFLCSCCSCCCEGLSRFLKIPNPGNMMITNYYAEVDAEYCIGCETCVAICPMKAIKIVDDHAQIKQKRCIGCGNCVAKCPSEAIKLHKKDRQFTPFPTMDDLFDKIMERKIAQKK